VYSNGTEIMFVQSGYII